MDKRLSAQLTYISLLLDKICETIDEIKSEHGATHAESDLIFLKTLFSTDYPRQDKTSD